MRELEHERRVTGRVGLAGRHLHQVGRRVDHRRVGQLQRRVLRMVERVGGREEGRGGEGRRQGGACPQRGAGPRNGGVQVDLVVGGAGRGRAPHQRGQAARLGAQLGRLGNDGEGAFTAARPEPGRRQRRASQFRRIRVLGGGKGKGVEDLPGGLAGRGAGRLYTPHKGHVEGKRAVGRGRGRDQQGLLGSIQ